MKGWRDEWTPESTTIFGCDVNIKSIHAEEFCNKCVGSFINWFNPNWEVILSMVLPSKFILSWLYQLLDLALKTPLIVYIFLFLAKWLSVRLRTKWLWVRVPLQSPLIVVIKEPFCARGSNVIPKLSEKVSKLSLDWLGELQRVINLQDLSPILSSKFRHSFK